MIAQITGTVVDTTEKSLVVEVHGIGYTVFSPARVGEGSIVLLYTHFVVKDDGQELYGFLTKEERSLFATLIGVSGVGPKTALHMLTLYSFTDLVQHIKTGNAKAIALVPGIGKKTAEKIVIDLKDTLNTIEGISDTTPDSDLVEALLSLGYKEYQIRGTLTAIDTALPLEKQITEALQLLNNIY